MGDSYRANMATGRRVNPVTGRTLKNSGVSGTYSNVQIMPYSQPYVDPSHNNPKPAKSKASKSWTFSNPEVKRRRRVVSYKVYTVEGRVKSSFRKSIRWLKSKYLEMRYGWW